MPRAKVDPVNGVTDEILGMTWDNRNACRLWFNRRGTSPTKLGLDTVEVNGAGGLVRVCRPGEGVPLQQLEFEQWADKTDGFLIGMQADAAPDAVLRQFYSLGMPPHVAATRIVADRVPPIVKAAAKAAARDVSKPVEQFVVRLGGPMSMEAAERLALAAARIVKVDALVVSTLTAGVVREVSAPARVAAPVKPRKDNWALIAPLLQRDGGASVDELKRALGWKTAPGKWFLAQWAADAGCLDALVDMGLVDDVRRFRLQGARR